MFSNKDTCAGCMRNGAKSLYPSPSYMSAMQLVQWRLSRFCNADQVHGSVRERNEWVVYANEQSHVEYMGLDNCYLLTLHHSLKLGSDKTC